MGELALAGLAFLAAHVIPTATGLRAWAIERIGRPAYLALYSLLSIGLLAWVIHAALSAPFIEVWPPSAVLSALTLVLMAVACWLFVGALRRPAQGSVSFRDGALDLADPGPAALLRHPLLTGFGLWALAHMLANGDVAALLLFGAAAVFAIGGARMLDRRAAKNGRPPATLARAPGEGLGAGLARALSGSGWLDLALGAALFAVLLWTHPDVIGVDPLTMLQ